MLFYFENSQLTQTYYFTLKLRHLDIFNMGYGSSQHIKLISKQKYFDKNMKKKFKNIIRKMLK